MLLRTLLIVLITSTAAFADEGHTDQGSDAAARHSEADAVAVHGAMFLPKSSARPLEQKLARVRMRVANDTMDLEDLRTLASMLDLASPWLCTEKGILNLFTEVRKLLGQLKPEKRKLWRGLHPGAADRLQNAKSNQALLKLARTSPHTDAGTRALSALATRFQDREEISLAKKLLLQAWADTTQDTDLSERASVAFRLGYLESMLGESKRVSPLIAELKRFPNSIGISYKGKEISPQAAAEVLAELKPNERLSEQRTVPQLAKWHKDNRQGLLEYIEAQALVSEVPAFPLFPQDIFSAKDAAVSLNMIRDLPNNCRFHPFPPEFIPVTGPADYRSFALDIPASALFDDETAFWNWAKANHVHYVQMEDLFLIAGTAPSLAGEFFSGESIKPFQDWAASASESAAPRSLGYSTALRNEYGQATFRPIRLTEWPKGVSAPTLSTTGEVGTSGIPSAALVESLYAEKIPLTIRQTIETPVLGTNYSGNGVDITHLGEDIDFDALAALIDNMPDQEFVKLNLMAGPKTEMNQERNKPLIAEWMKKHGSKIDTLQYNRKFYDVRALMTTGEFNPTSASK